MSLTETPPTVPAKKSRRAGKRRKKAVLAAAPKSVPLYAGLTANDCCGECNAIACILSGKPYCAHPFKGGLQGRDMQDDAAVARADAAKKLLGKAKVKVDGI